MTSGFCDTVCVVALGQHAAARQHGDRVAQPGDDLEVVLHHQDVRPLATRRISARSGRRPHAPCRRSARRAAASAGRAPASWRSRAPACGHRAARRRSVRVAGQPDIVEQFRGALVVLPQHALPTARNRSEPPRCRCSATRTFSSTVRCGNTAEIWKLRTRPSRATSAGACR